MLLSSSWESITTENVEDALVLDRQEAVGGERGHAFDSGCQLSRLLKIHICCGSLWLTPYVYTIKRIAFEFERPTKQQNKDNDTSATSSTMADFSCPSYSGWSVSGSCDHRIVEIDADDSIKRIDVWTDGNLVNAIRFHFGSGMVSEVYGMPIPGSVPVSFEGRDPSWKLVGLYGRFGGAMNKLGFVFATRGSGATCSMVR